MREVKSTVDVCFSFINCTLDWLKRNEAFYFRPKSKSFSFENSPVGINTLNSILPNLCKAAEIKRKTAHCLPVTCVSKLFDSGVEEKLIRERTGHRSNALFAYEKTSEKKVSHVSALLGAEMKTENKEEKLKCSRYEERRSEGFFFLRSRIVM